MGKKRSKKKKNATPAFEDLYDKFEIGNDTIQDIENDFHCIFEKDSAFQEEYVHSKFMKSYRHNQNNNAVERTHFIRKRNYFDAEPSKEKIQAQPLFPFRKTLPAYERRNEISQIIKSNQVIVISGETGR